MKLLVIARLCACVSLLAILSACASSSDMAYAPSAYAAPEALNESLFSDDQAVMSNENLARVLDARIELPAQARLVVVRYGQLPYWWGWSEDFVRLNQQIDTDFLARLGTAQRLRQVQYLPSLVTPPQMTIPYLRQAAARCQADLVLVYRTATRSYDRQRFLGRDEAKAYCTVEAILVDTRTGTIPFGAAVTEHFQAKRTSKDMAFAETVARAEQQAIGRAWVKLADQVVKHLQAQ